jgi:hypothetical protein
MPEQAVWQVKRVRGVSLFPRLPRCEQPSAWSALRFFLVSSRPCSRHNFRRGSGGSGAGLLQRARPEPHRVDYGSDNPLAYEWCDALLRGTGRDRSLTSAR